MQIMIDISCEGGALLHVSSALFGYHITGKTFAFFTYLDMSIKPWKY
jgi:hypothetical protein